MSEYKNWEEAMLYRFGSAIAGDVVMLASHAEEIFSVLNRSLEPRGVIPANQLSAAIAELEKAMTQSRNETLIEEAGEEDEEKVNAIDAVPFYARAQPFLNLLKESNIAQKDVTWGI